MRCNLDDGWYAAILGDIDIAYWKSAASSLGRLIRRSPREFARDVLTAGVRAEQLMTSSPYRDLFEAFPGSDGLSVPMGDVTFRPNNLDPYEQYALGVMAKLIQPRRVFEIGTFDGATTLLIARCAPDAEILTLDLPPESAAVATLTAEAANIEAGEVGVKFRDSPEAARITQLYGDSRTFDFTPWHGSVDLVVVDGGHEYDVAASDTRSAHRLLTRGGAIVWDDYMPYWPGVVQAVEESNLAVFHLARTDLAVYRSTA